MIKLVVTLLLSIAAGFGLGTFQNMIMYSDIEERFVSSRMTEAEESGEMSTAQVLARSSARAKLEIEGGTTYNFGTMKHGETMSHGFVFRNIGEDPLNLEMGESTCKCTVGDLDQSILYPGEETTVTLTWTAQSLLSEYVQTATIHTTDPVQSLVQLQIMGRIAHSFVVEPPELVLGGFSVNESLIKKLHIFTYLEDSEDLEEFIWAGEDSRDSVDIEVKKVDWDAERFPQHRNAHQAHEVTVNISPGLPMGALSTMIQFKTDLGSKVGTIEIPVTGNVYGDFSLFGGASFDTSRSIVDFGSISSSKGASVTIWLAAQGDLKDQVEPSVVSIVPDEALDVTIGEPSERGKRRVFPLRFNVPKGAPEVYYPGTASENFGKVLIDTNLEVASDIPIYIRLVVKP